MDTNRGILNFSIKATMGFITNASSNEIVNGSITEAVSLRAAPAIMQVITVTRKKFALPELKLLN
jgi:hypothetical protein